MKVGEFSADTFCGYWSSVSLHFFPFLPPGSGVAKIMFSIVRVCLSTRGVPRQAPTPLPFPNRVLLRQPVQDPLFLARTVSSERLVFAWSAFLYKIHLPYINCKALTVMEDTRSHKVQQWYFNQFGDFPKSCLVVFSRNVSLCSVNTLTPLFFFKKIVILLFGSNFLVCKSTVPITAAGNVQTASNNL